MSRIELDGVGVDLDGAPVLHQVTAHLDADRIAVVGANGSGKSTLLRLLDGLLPRPAVSGRVRVLGLDPVRDARKVHRRVGFVFTDPDTQIVMPTVREDVAFSLRGLGLSPDAAADRVRAQLDAYGLAGLADAPAHSLSGGQKQLLALAAVLVRDPGLVLADEPTTMLDLPNSRRVADLLIDGIGRPLIVATHDLDLAARCDLALRFEGGRLIATGAPADIIAAYRRECA
jgi:biotin transport system ATP-binding protein